MCGSHAQGKGPRYPYIKVMPRTQEKPDATVGDITAVGKTDRSEKRDSAAHTRRLECGSPWVCVRLQVGIARSRRLGTNKRQFELINKHLRNASAVGIGTHRPWARAVGACIGQHWEPQMRQWARPAPTPAATVVPVVYFLTWGPLGEGSAPRWT